MWKWVLFILIPLCAGLAYGQTLIEFKQTEAAGIEFPVISPFSPPPLCDLIAAENFIEYEIAFFREGSSEVLSYKIPAAPNIGTDRYFRYKIPLTGFPVGTYFVQSRWTVKDISGVEKVTEWCDSATQVGCIVGCPTYSPGKYKMVIVSVVPPLLLVPPVLLKVTP